MTADEKLKKIAEILDFENEKDAYYNLEGAIQDINNDNKCDYVSMNTLLRVREQLAEVYKVFEC